MPCLLKTVISGQESVRRHAGSEHALASGRYSQPAMPPKLGSCFRVQDSGVRVHGFGFRVSDFSGRVSDFRSSVSDFEICVLCFVCRDSGIWFWV